jgi:hypothetical protein
MSKGAARQDEADETLFIITEMSVLLWSTLVYLLGVAILLLLRPLFMFRKDGTWKEFGLQMTDDTSLFPFWMFCVSWAIVSYFIVRIGFSQEVAAATAAVVTTAAQAPAAATAPAPAPARKSRDLLPEYEDENAILPLQPARGGAMPGYYKMKGKKGSKFFPEYIYIGPDVPDDEE